MPELKRPGFVDGTTQMFWFKAHKGI